MSDIVERLRQKERDYYRRDTGGAFGMGPVLREAADEIERLRVLLREARAYVEPLCIEDDDTRDLAGRIDAELDGVDQPDTARAEFNARYANEPTVDGRVELLKAEMRRICAGASQQAGAHK